MFKKIMAAYKVKQAKRDQKLSAEGYYPIYFRWWFILLAIIAVLCMFGYALAL